MLSIFFQEYESDWHVGPFQTQLSVQHHLRYSNQTYFEWQQKETGKKTGNRCVISSFVNTFLLEKAVGLSLDFDPWIEKGMNIAYYTYVRFECDSSYSLVLTGLFSGS